jgi:hypothetical protein
MPDAIIRRNVQPRPGLEIILRETGQGSPVLVLHGAPGPDRIAAFVLALDAFGLIGMSCCRGCRSS